MVRVRLPQSDPSRCYMITMTPDEAMENRICRFSCCESENLRLCKGYMFTDCGNCYIKSYSWRDRAAAVQKPWPKHLSQDKESIVLIGIWNRSPETSCDHCRVLFNVMTEETVLVKRERLRHKTRLVLDIRK